MGPQSPHAEPGRISALLALGLFTPRDSLRLLLSPPPRPHPPLTPVLVHLDFCSFTVISIPNWPHFHFLCLPIHPSLCCSYLFTTLFKNLLWLHVIFSVKSKLLTRRAKPFPICSTPLAATDGLSPLFFKFFTLQPYGNAPNTSWSMGISWALHKFFPLSGMQSP